MSFWNFISIDFKWVIFSIVLLFIILIWYLLNNKIKPSFVIPFKRIILYKYLIEKILLFIIVSVIIIFPMNIWFIKWKVIDKQKTFNIQILFDVSLSMSADDIKPSRFDSAKNSMIGLVKNLSWYNVSVVMFSGIPFVRSPFSDDTDSLVSKLDDLRLSDFPPTINFVWTAIWDAILLWIKNIINFSNIKDNPWIIILLTDWDSNKWSEPLQATDISQNKNIPIYTLWIWKENYLVWYDHFNSPILTSINIELLKNISKNSWWKFYRVLTDQEFKNIFDEIHNYIKLQEKDIVYNEYFYLNNYLYWLLFISLSVYLLIKIYILFWLRN